ncbi:MAG: hypothetical protein U0746_10590 [Gemmataceae bacterium]
MGIVMAAFFAWALAVREYPVPALTLVAVCLVLRHWPCRRGPHF